MHHLCFVKTTPTAAHHLTGIPASRSTTRTPCTGSQVASCVTPLAPPCASSLTSPRAAHTAAYVRQQGAVSLSCHRPGMPSKPAPRQMSLLRWHRCRRHLPLTKSLLSTLTPRSSAALKILLIGRSTAGRHLMRRVHLSRKKVAGKAPMVRRKAAWRRHQQTGMATAVQVCHQYCKCKQKRCWLTLYA